MCGIASDRKLTWTDTGDTYDDNANKCVLYDGRIAFAFTGLARFRRASTDKWLTSTLAEAPSDGGLEQTCLHIANKATAELRRVPRSLPRDDRWVSFVGAGWASSENRLVAVEIVISNRDGSGLVSDDFKVRTSFCYPDDRPTTLLEDHGCKLSAHDRSELLKEVRYYRHRPNRHDLISSALVSAIRATSDRTSKVGKRVLTAVVPAAAVSNMRSDGSSMALAGDPRTPSTVPSFRYWEDGSWDGITYGPSFVLAGGPAATGFRAGPIWPDLGHLEIGQLGGFTIHYPAAWVLMPDGTPAGVTRSDGIPHGVLFLDEDKMARALAGPLRGGTPRIIVGLDELFEFISDPSVPDLLVLDPDSETGRPVEVISREQVARWHEGHQL